MRHHYREILSTSLPCEKSSNAVDIKSALAHVEDLHWKPRLQNIDQFLSKEYDESTKKLPLVLIVLT